MATLVNPSEQAARKEQATQKVILRNISWDTYERLVTEHGDRGGTHFTYDSRVMEIMVLSQKHEESNRTLALLVDLVAGELEIDVRRLGSKTFKREDLLKGFEPDSCFYIQHVGAIQGKDEVDLRDDPPPDLVIEVDVTSPSLPRFPIFAAVGVPEVWRFDGERVRFYTLEAGRYAEVEQSLALPPLTGAVATRLLGSSKQMRSTEWLRVVREWARQTHTED
jgi:Uma2 family endonuclease